MLITCGGNQLLAEGEAFGKRLEVLGKRVEKYEAEEVFHCGTRRRRMIKAMRRGIEHMEPALGL